MKPAVYVETSVISYLTSRPGRDLIVAGRQQITCEWWQDVRPKVEYYVSPFVIEEASRGDEKAARLRLSAISEFPVLVVNEEIRDLALTYFDALDIPGKAKIDAFHLATAVWHRMDYLVTWNCKHIASGRVRKTLRQINATLGIPTPVICTPEELMEV